MKIRPLYDRIVVKRVESEAEKTSGGLFIPDSAKEKPQEGEVVAVGKGKRLEDGKVVPLDVEVGRHHLEARAGQASKEQDVDAPAGQIVRVTLLEAEPPANPTQVAAAQPGVQPSGVRSESESPASAGAAMGQPGSSKPAEVGTHGVSSGRAITTTVLGGTALVALGLGAYFGTSDWRWLVGSIVLLATGLTR